MNALAPMRTLPDAIAVFLPACTDAHELDLRRKLLRARDFASQHLWRWRDVSPDLFALYRVIAAQAGAAAFGPSATLEPAWQACHRLLNAAGLIEELEAARYDV